MSRGGKQSPLLHRTKQQIVRLYRENPELNVEAVAELCGCAHSTAWKVLTENGIEIRGASKWLSEHAHKQRILRRWDVGKSSLAIARHFKLRREGVARLIAADRPYDRRMRAMLKAVFGNQAETRDFLTGLSCRGNAGRCAICRTTDARLFKNYCPDRGILRDLLCARCSQGLGCFNNDAAALIQAAAYLIKHSANPGEKPRPRPRPTQPIRQHSTLTWGRASRRSRTSPKSKTTVRNRSCPAPVLA